MHPGLRIMEVDLNTGCLGMTSTGQALVTSVRERERGRGVFSQRAHCNQWKRGEKRKGSEGLPELCLKLQS